VSTLWILDTRTSALSLSAHLNAGADDEFLYGTDYLSLSILIRKIISSKATNILFSWRQPLLDALSNSKQLRLLKCISHERKIFFLVADFASVDNNRINSEIRASEFVDGILFTSKSLEKAYSKKLPKNVATGILYDRVNDSMRTELNSRYPKKKGQVIWIGNSQWGRGLGFVDYKGLHAIVEPLREYCASINCPHEFLIIDSASQTIPNSLVLKSIRESEILLMPSISEGTGMTVLEALSLGTAPICTETGVAPEVLLGELSNLMVPRKIDSYIQSIHDVNLFEIAKELRLNAAYDAHIRNMIQSFVLLASFQKKRAVFVKEESSTKNSHVYLARFLRARLKSFRDVYRLNRSREIQRTN
jgi:glycosyltransferase involved in cell wall biosynthesis